MGYIAIKAIIEPIYKEWGTEFKKLKLAINLALVLALSY